ncbi:type II toxin-antitoxin system RelE/ParE family toxin [Proteiniclasticum sp.]|uniref:type II toxin-antitoxin system RelE family toxin n=1 Tax=Proteiniclasticum sp. TaxID=2053595 RepID=UPI0028985F11|nr:type II toxin-antitoxin system RelE/ParE family toxin [Proteiniclasticum sp.]
MSWQIKFYEEAIVDIENLDGSKKKEVMKGILKVSQNPLSNTEGGYGKPLGNKSGVNLTGFFKIRFRQSGLRIDYYLERQDEIMNIVIVSIRDNDYVYEQAAKRSGK